jgi:hypothetical protein
MFDQNDLNETDQECWNSSENENNNLSIDDSKKKNLIDLFGNESEEEDDEGEEKSYKTYSELTINDFISETKSFNHSKSSYLNDLSKVILIRIVRLISRHCTKF